MQEISEENRRFSVTGTSCIRCGNTIAYWRSSCADCWKNHRSEVIAIKSLAK